MSLIASIDAGTSSVRVILFNKEGKEVAKHQSDLTLLTPHSGWVEQDPLEIITSIENCMFNILSDNPNIKKQDIIAVGVTNQRETTVVWDAITSKPLYNAIVWQDIRTSTIVQNLVTKYKSKDAIRNLCGLPFSTYFSAPKLCWLYNNIPLVKEKINNNECKFGTIDTWILWNLLSNNRHFTDVSNASRTMLMNIHTLQWDLQLLKIFNINPNILPEIKPSCFEYGQICQESNFAGLKICAVVGDQQSALLGQLCFNVGQIKHTYGTSAMMLCNTGENIIESKYGLLTTVLCQIGYGFGQKNDNNGKLLTLYALEGSIACAGTSVKFLRDNLHIVSSAQEVDELAAKLSNSKNEMKEQIVHEPWNITNGVYFVPAFSGLFCPYWRDDARGLIYGLTMNTKREHICRAVLEGVCYRTSEVYEAMQNDCKQIEIGSGSIIVDGGMARSDILLQIQSDILQISIQRSSVIESTALGTAILAGMCIGIWKDFDDVRDCISVKGDVVFKPSISSADAGNMKDGWKDAVSRCFSKQSKI